MDLKQTNVSNVNSYRTIFLFSFAKDTIVFTCCSDKMGRKSTETTKSERALIIKLHNQCKSLSEIAKVINRPRSTVHSIIDRFGTTKSHQNKPRSGRPRKVTDRMRRKIMNLVKQNPKMSSKILKDISNIEGVDLSRSTVRNVLHSSGYHSRSARKKCWVSHKNKKERLIFAEDYKDKSSDFWERVIFSDESKYTVFGSGSHCRV